MEWLSTATVSGHLVTGTSLARIWVTHNSICRSMCPDPAGTRVLFSLITHALLISKHLWARVTGLVRHWACRPLPVQRLGCPMDGFVSIERVVGTCLVYSRAPSSLSTHPSDALSCLLIHTDPNPFLGIYPIWSWLFPTLPLGYPRFTSSPAISRFFFFSGSPGSGGGGWNCQRAWWGRSQGLR